MLNFTQQTFIDVASQVGITQVIGTSISGSKIFKGIRLITTCLLESLYTMDKFKRLLHSRRQNSINRITFVANITTRSSNEEVNNLTTNCGRIKLNSLP